MSLIKCQECGREISDKSNACIHCGFPLAIENKEDIHRIIELFDEYATSGHLNGKVSNIYSAIVSEINIIKSENNEVDSNDIIAQDIIDGLCKIPSRVSWIDVKLFCELIKFSTLSNDAIDYFTNQLHSVISIKRYNDDGSGGYSYITPFFYAEYMILQYGSEHNKAKLMTILKEPYLGKQTGYELVVSMYRQHGDGNSMQQIATVQSRMENIKCPICSSKKVKKISAINRVASVATFGLASSKIGKQYQCNNCNHKW